MAKKNYRFEYAGDKYGNKLSKITHCLCAVDDTDAFTQAAAYLTDILGKYVPRSMQVFQDHQWQPVCDQVPALAAA